MPADKQYRIGVPTFVVVADRINQLYTPGQDCFMVPTTIGRVMVYLSGNFKAKDPSEGLWFYADLPK
jgi:hypothetical protein